jgi:serine protease Do
MNVRNNRFVNANQTRCLRAVAYLLTWVIFLGVGQSLAQQTPPSFSNLAKKVAHSVVNISTTQKLEGEQAMPWLMPEGPFRDYFERFFGEMPLPPLETQALGSGFIIDRQGHIFTNNHVVAKATEIRVRLQNGEEYDAEVIGRDPKTDIALIRIQAEAQLPPPAELGNSEDIQVGDWVLAVGNPFGLGHTVTAGIIGAKSRMIGAGPYDNFIQTDAAINPGNSGGPLFNSKGQVVGINTAIVAQGQGIGFAIPINMARELLPQLKTGKVVRGYLGIGIQDVAEELSQALNLKTEKGVIVSQVMPNTPAAVAGLQEGDVIVSVNGKPVETAHGLSARVAGMKPGKEVDLKIVREGKEQTLTATLGTMPSAEVVQAGPSDRQPKPKWGMGVQDITPEMARRLNLDSDKGVVVVQVTPGSPAAKAELQRGDVIRSVEREKIGSMQEFMQAIRQAEDKKQIVLRVQRDEQYFYTVLKAG